MSSNAAIAYRLETPYPLQPSRNYFRLEGWALILNADQSTLTRIRVEDKIFAPESTPVRKDVAALYPDSPHALASGFVFVCFLPFGTHLGQLEASADHGKSWAVVKSMIIPVSSHPLRGSFEPAGVNGRLNETARLAGWCWHPEFSIKEVKHLFGDRELPVDFGLPRPDVLQHFPDQPESEFSGFITQENLPRGKGTIRLQVTTTCGRVYFLDPALEATLPSGSFAPPRQHGEMWDDDVFAQLRTSRLAKDSAHTSAIGPTNILFALYGDFTSNSANHVSAFANELISRGYDCIVAVPQHMETIGSQPDARFLAIEFDDLEQLPSFYRDGQGPTLVHVWTTRQLVDAFASRVRSLFKSQLIVHLEDNEREILARHLNLSLRDLAALSDVELTKLTPESLSHPHRAESFLRTAKGVTLIVDELAEFVPPGIPHRTIWPAASAAFFPRPQNFDLRKKLGIAAGDIVVFYHGNVHQSNAAEVGELYRAIAQVNGAGYPAWLVRTGRDLEGFKTSFTSAERSHVIELGFVKRAKDLPAFMSLADVFVQPGQPGPFNDYRFPSKLPEFFALGRPVILPRTNLGQTVVHRRDAYVLEHANADSISRAIIELRQHPDLAHTLAQGALDFAARQFSWTRSTDLLLAFYHEVTSLGQPDEKQISAAASINRALTPTVAS